MAVFDQSSFGSSMRDSEPEPFWWTKGWTEEQKRLAGDPKNRAGHMQRMRFKVDEDRAREPDASFGPEISK